MPIRSFFRRLFTRKHKTPPVPAPAPAPANTTKKRARLSTPNKPSGSYAHLRGYKTKTISSRKNSPYYNKLARGTDTKTNNKSLKK